MEVSNKVVERFKGSSSAARALTWADQVEAEKSISKEIHLLDLDLEFWGKSTLDKLAGKVSFPIRTDKKPAEKERISYVRILVDVDTNLEVIEEFSFRDLDGLIHVQKVEYEWLPAKWCRYHLRSHRASVCTRKFIPKQQWVRKAPILPDPTPQIAPKPVFVVPGQAPTVKEVPSASSDVPVEDNLVPSSKGII
ncbi:hypothetical protein Droror1_Dr00012706 [Drosera rotundifolia]